MNKAEQLASDALGSLSAIEQDMRLKSNSYARFLDLLYAADAKPIPFERSRLEAMRMAIATTRPGLEELAVEQVQKIGSFLTTINLPGVVLCYLVCGVLPPAGDPTAADGFETLDGTLVPPHHTQVRDAAWLMRRWKDAEENTGLVDWIVFLRWCVETDIDTNYLRLICELTGTGARHPVGQLPLEEMVKYGRQF